MGLQPVKSGEPTLPAGLAPLTPGAPALPAGVAPSQPAEPNLPPGLMSPHSSEPALPLGLGSADREREERDEAYVWRLPEGLSGFWEVRGGVRLQRDSHERRASLGESRLQLQYERSGEHVGFKLVPDFIYDTLADRHSIDLESGRGFLDLRQAYLLLRPADFLDVTMGRQIITWGTGDMIFINDLFPKDWNSYFCGRDDEYLKAPSDAIRTTWFSSLANLDLVYTPRFDSDRYIDGRRISFWNSGLGRRSGRNAVVDADKPDRFFKDDEWAARLYRMVGTYEVALYGYDGFWKSPGGMSTATGKAIFPRLRGYGASARGPFASGILSAESGFYQSRDDTNGRNPFVNNSEMRYLLGYEQELARDLTGGLQYYVENILDYGAYKRTLPKGARARDEYRQVITARLTQLLMSQNLSLGCFVYFSPTDRDTFIRPKVSYKIDDHWVVEAGATIFLGAYDHTFFGQFERNNNIFASLRYGF